METFAFLKIMNNQTQPYSTLVMAVPILCAAFAVAPAPAQAQESSGPDRVAVTMTDPSRPALVKASLINGGITVKAYDGKEVIVEARARYRDRDSSRSESGNMKRIIVSSTGLSVEAENNEVHINTDSYARPIDLTITVPVHTSLKLSAVNDGNIVVTGVDGELDVNDVNGSVTLNNVSGSAVAHALNGRVLVTFTRVNQKPMAFSSLNGDIDVTFPADLKANLSLKSDRGDIFTDFDFQAQASAPQQTVEDGRKDGGKYVVKIDKSVHGTIGGGGPEMQFTNFNGSIYIRKAGAAR